MDGKGVKEEQIYTLGYFLQSFPNYSHAYSLECFLEVYYIKNFVKHTLEYFLVYLLHWKTKVKAQ